MIFADDKLKLIDNMIEDFRDENISYGNDPDTLIDCIKTVIEYGKEDSAE